jgi:hypothetical protein
MGHNKKVPASQRAENPLRRRCLKTLASINPFIRFVNRRDSLSAICMDRDEARMESFNILNESVTSGTRQTPRGWNSRNMGIGRGNPSNLRLTKKANRCIFIALNKDVRPGTSIPDGRPSLFCRLKTVFSIEILALIARGARYTPRLVGARVRVAHLRCVWGGKAAPNTI